MLDVHAPHEPINSWKGFVLHIATIVIGLLIAVGLEQTVEYFHHRHEVREARDALAAEHGENISRYHDNVRGHLLRLAIQNNGQRVLRYLLAHPGTLSSQVPREAMSRWTATWTATWTASGNNSERGAP